MVYNTVACCHVEHHLGSLQLTLHGLSDCVHGCLVDSSGEYVERDSQPGDAPMAKVGKTVQYLSKLLS